MIEDWGFGEILGMFGILSILAALIIAIGSVVSWVYSLHGNIGVAMVLLAVGWVLIVVGFIIDERL